MTGGPPPPPPPTANYALGPFGKKFVGFGLILLGLWTAPGPATPNAAWIIPGSLMGIGVIGLLTGVRETWGEGWYPFDEVRGGRGALARFFWAFRPRPWLIAWLAIVATFVGWGSPHMLWSYGGGHCTYFGLNGVEEVWVRGECPMLKAFRLQLI